MKILALVLLVHQAPSGWAYPQACCANQDCREVAQQSIKELPDGYHLPSGEVVGYLDKRVRESPDGEWHLCTVQGLETGRAICLFIPPRGF
jgi:hypothetical protein